MTGRKIKIFTPRLKRTSGGRDKRRDVRQNTRKVVCVSVRNKQVVCFVMALHNLSQSEVSTQFILLVLFGSL